MSSDQGALRQPTRRVGSPRARRADEVPRLGGALRRNRLQPAIWPEPSQLSFIILHQMICPERIIWIIHVGSYRPFPFRRPEVAAGMADARMGLGPSHYGSGLFLTAPRRTGKSTFMREDLVPALKDRGVLTTYVDLWEDRQRDPGCSSLTLCGPLFALSTVPAGTKRVVRWWCRTSSCCACRPTAQS